MFFSPIFFFFQTTPQMKLFVFRPSMNVQRQGRVFEPGGSGGEPPFDSLSNHHSGHQQQQQHHPIYNNSRHAAGEDDPLQVYLKNGIVQSSKTAVFNLQKRQFEIIKNGSFQLSKMALKKHFWKKKDVFAKLQEYILQFTNKCR